MWPKWITYLNTVLVLIIWPHWSLIICMQAKQAIAALGSAANAEFGGDMSWRDDDDGPFPLSAGRWDAWTTLRSSLASSWTHDAAWNEEAGVFHRYVACSGTMRKRSDRFVCKLKDYWLSSIELIGDRNLGPNYTTEWHVQPDFHFSQAELPPWLGSNHRSQTMILPVYMKL